MRRILTTLTVAASSLLAVACATQNHSTAKLEARSTLAEAPRLAATNTAAVVGKSSMAWRDRWTATNLFERAAANRDSVENRFNLAVGYQSTGRLQDAAAIYRTLTTDGQYSWAVTSRDVYNRDVSVRRFNVADESARRLAQINATTRYAAIPTTGAFSASELGAPVSAIVGGGPVRGRVSDATAISLDEQGAGGL
jgi:hypothetical protein